MTLKGSLKRRWKKAGEVREARRVKSQTEKDIYRTAYESEREKKLGEAGRMRARAELKAGKLGPKSSRVVRGLRTLGEGAVRASIEAERGGGSRRRTRYFDPQPTRRRRAEPFSDDWAAQELRGTIRAPSRPRRKKSKPKGRDIIIRVR